MAIKNYGFLKILIAKLGFEPKTFCWWDRWTTNRSTLHYIISIKIYKSWGCISTKRQPPSSIYIQLVIPYSVLAPPRAAATPLSISLPARYTDYRLIGACASSKPYSRRNPFLGGNFGDEFARNFVRFSLLNNRTKIKTKNKKNRLLKKLMSFILHKNKNFSTNRFELLTFYLYKKASFLSTNGVYR